MIHKIVYFFYLAETKKKKKSFSCCPNNYIMNVILINRFMKSFSFNFFIVVSKNVCVLGIHLIIYSIHKNMFRKLYLYINTNFFNEC